MPVALALHGRLAGWQPTWAAYQTKPGRGSNWDIEPHSTLGGFARFVHSTIWERIVVANRRAGLQLDVYIHSWNPEIGPLLDRLYRPNRSRHDPIRIGLDKVASQHLSIKRVLELCADEVHRTMPCHGTSRVCVLECPPLGRPSLIKPVLVKSYLTLGSTY